MIRHSVTGGIPSNSRDGYIIMYSRDFRFVNQFDTNFSNFLRKISWNQLVPGFAVNLTPHHYTPFVSQNFLNALMMVD